MSGGKSSSTTTTQTTQENVQQTVDGLTLAPVNQTNSGDFYVTDEFNTNVKEAFLGLLTLANDAGAAAVDFSKTAIDVASQRAEQIDSPQLAVLTKLGPAIMASVVILGLYYGYKVYKGK